MKKWFEKYDIWTKLLSVIAAVILWTYFMNIQNPTRTLEYKNISVQLTGVDELYNSYNLKVISGMDATVDVKVSGPSSRLATLTASQIKVRANLMNSITVPGTYEVSYYVVLPESGMSCVNRNPETITVTVDRVETKTVPVQVEYSTEESGSYIFEEPEFTASTIDITGPESELEKVTSAVVSIDTAEMTATVTDNYIYKLVDKNGNAVDTTNISRNVTSISVTVPVKKIKTVPLEVSLSPEGSGQDVTATISPSSVQIIGDPATVEEIESILLGAININNIADGDTFDFEVILPTGVQLKDGQPTTATVTIAFHDAATKTFSTTDIQLQDVDKDPSAKVTLETKSLEVTLSGPQKMLDSIGSGDVHAVVELASNDLSDGQHTIGATITSPDGTTVIGTYSVTIRIARS